MPTTYTPLLGLSLPATGELSGTWGTEANNGITSLLDGAIAGTTTLNTDADVTLTTTTGAANQARQQLLLCTGARTLQRNITAPAQSKTYVVINATTGGFGVLLRGVGPTAGVVIANGERAVVAWNGTDFVKISNTAGIAQIADGAAATPGLSFAADTDTGIFRPGANTLAFATAGAERMRIDASGNVGIGTSSPTQPLTMEIGDTLSGTRVISSGTGAGGVPVYEGIAYRGDNNTSFGTRFAAAFRNSSGSGVAANQTLGMLLFGGQWGTSTTFQAANLRYAASIVGVAEGSFTSATAMPTAISFRTGSTGDDAYTPNFTYGTERMRIDSSGRVGIGTNNPLTALSVLGTGDVRVTIGNATAGIQAGVDASNNTLIGTNQAVPFSLFTSGTERMRIDASGNLLVGTTTSPTVSRVYVESTEARIQSRNTTSGANGYVGAVNSNEWRVRTITSTDLTFGTNDVERMRIPSVGIPSIQGGLLLNNPTADNDLSIVGSSGTVQLRMYAAQMGIYTPIGMTTTPFVFTLANVERMRITASGNVVAGGSVALATTATDGFLYVPTCAGTPTGVPTAITGMAPIVVNTTNNKLYFYSSGAWRDAGP